MWVFISRGKAWILVGIYAVGMLCNVLLNLVFIPRFGYIAASVLTGLSEAIILAMFIGIYILSKKYETLRIY